MSTFLMSRSSFISLTTESSAFCFSEMISSTVQRSETFCISSLWIKYGAVMSRKARKTKKTQTGICHKRFENFASATFWCVTSKIGGRKNPTTLATTSAKLKEWVIAIRNQFFCNNQASLNSNLIGGTCREDSMIS